jgi:hypothetical protein
MELTDILNLHRLRPFRAVATDGTLTGAARSCRFLGFTRQAREQLIAWARAMAASVLDADGLAFPGRFNEQRKDSWRRAV